MPGSPSPMAVFVAGAPGIATAFLAESLATSRAIAVATVAIDGARDDPARVFLDGALPDTRCVFLAADAGELTPPGLDALAPGRWCRVERPRLLAEPSDELQRVCRFLEIAYDQAMLGPVERAGRAARAAAAGGELRTPLTSASTPSFGETLERTAGSLLISTYQTNRLVCARIRDGAVNTHFRTYDKPMGIAVAPGRIALGTRNEVWDLRDMPRVAAQIEPAGSHDACYLPRRRHVTGDIAVHDLAFAGGELWLVATAFSCLATLDDTHSFVPRWRPPFITALAPEDRCHLNGVAVIDDRPAYVTAVGTTDEPGGWRPAKAGGGVLIDVGSSQVAIAGLSMPHSPRWHQGRLWLLESGRGTLCAADPAAGTVEIVAELPGFTRGLAFAGQTAFVGLSQIRESATFGELPVTRRPGERQCGVWAVDLGTGAVSGFLRFDGLVQEIFDVAVLHRRRFPEIGEPGDPLTGRAYALP
ncbi:MAG TPA: TIGR03032 family protein [Solirubrobacteraceae bacterium]|nr:TIGR03032 family protein [Solirubrobacteraceae bacterium]